MVWKRLVLAAVAVVLLVSGGCVGSQQSDQSGNNQPSAGTPTTPAGTPSASATSAADDSEAMFTELLDEHRELEQDPGDAPTPEQYYTELLDKHEADLSGCTKQAKTSDTRCKKPRSMGQGLQETVNIELLLDASGSMADAADSGTKMQVASRVLTDFVDTLPENANVSLRVFGHEGTGSNADKKRSCASTDQLVGFDQAGSSGVKKAITSVQPAGWTPLARALNESRKGFGSVATKKTSNFVYLISDGIETCGGDPVSAARELSDAGVGVDVNIVGFDVDKKAARQLRQAADAADGKYTDAAGADGLSKAFNSYDWQAWTKWYNCRWDKAHSDYNETWDAANANYNCVWENMHGEYNAIWDEVNKRYNTIWDGANGEYNAIWDDAQDIEDTDTRDAVVDAARQRKAGLVDPAKENKQFATSNAKERRETLVKAAKEGRDDLVQDAQQTRDRIVKKAERAKKKAEREDG